MKSFLGLVEQGLIFLGSEPGLAVQREIADEWVNVSGEERKNIFVLFENNTAIAFLRFEIGHQNPQQANSQKIYVRNGYRSRGLALQLHENTFKVLQKRGVKVYSVGVYPNSLAQRFHRRLIGRQSGSESVFDIEPLNVLADESVPLARFKVNLDKYQFRSEVRAEETLTRYQKQVGGSHKGGKLTETFDAGKSIVVGTAAGRFEVLVQGAEVVIRQTATFDTATRKWSPVSNAAEKKGKFGTQIEISPKRTISIAQAGEAYQFTAEDLGSNSGMVVGWYNTLTTKEEEPVLVDEADESGSGIVGLSEADIAELVEAEASGEALPVKEYKLPVASVQVEIELGKAKGKKPSVTDVFVPGRRFHIHSGELLFSIDVENDQPTINLGRPLAGSTNWIVEDKRWPIPLGEVFEVGRKPQGEHNFQVADVVALSRRAFQIKIVKKKDQWWMAVTDLGSQSGTKVEWYKPTARAEARLKDSSEFKVPSLKLNKKGKLKTLNSKLETPAEGGRAEARATDIHSQTMVVKGETLELELIETNLYFDHQEDILRLWKLMKSDGEMTREKVEQMLEQEGFSPDLSFAVLDSKGKMIGIINVNQTTSPEYASGQAIYISRFAVDTEYQGTPVAFWLMYHALTKAKIWKFEKVHWKTVRDENVQAVRFYEKTGAKVVRQIPPSETAQIPNIWHLEFATDIAPALDNLNKLFQEKQGRESRAEARGQEMGLPGGTIKGEMLQRDLDKIGAAVSAISNGEAVALDLFIDHVYAGPVTVEWDPMTDYIQPREGLGTFIVLLLERLEKYDPAGNYKVSDFDSVRLTKQLYIETPPKKEAPKVKSSYDWPIGENKFDVVFAEMARTWEEEIKAAMPRSREGNTRARIAPVESWDVSAREILRTVRGSSGETYFDEFDTLRSLGDYHHSVSLEQDGDTISLEGDRGNKWTISPFRMESSYDHGYGLSGTNGSVPWRYRKPVQLIRFLTNERKFQIVLWKESYEDWEKSKHEIPEFDGIEIVAGDSVTTRPSFARETEINKVVSELAENLNAFRQAFDEMLKGLSTGHVGVFLKHLVRLQNLRDAVHDHGIDREGVERITIAFRAELMAVNIFRRRLASQQKDYSDLQIFLSMTSAKALLSEALQSLKTSEFDIAFSKLAEFERKLTGAISKLSLERRAQVEPLASKFRELKQQIDTVKASLERSEVRTGERTAYSVEGAEKGTGNRSLLSHMPVPFSVNANQARAEVRPVENQISPAKDTRIYHLENELVYLRRRISDLVRQRETNFPKGRAHAFIDDLEPEAAKINQQIRTLKQRRKLIKRHLRDAKMENVGSGLPRPFEMGAETAPLRSETATVRRSEVRNEEDFIQGEAGRLAKLVAHMSDQRPEFLTTLLTKPTDPQLPADQLNGVYRTLRHKQQDVLKRELNLLIARSLAVGLSDEQLKSVIAYYAGIDARLFYPDSDWK